MTTVRTLRDDTEAAGSERRGGQNDVTIRNNLAVQSDRMV